MAPPVATGQEEPLPVVLAKAGASEPPATVSIDLPVEPIFQTPASTTLAEAARGNDYASFHAMYVSSSDRAAYESLHELWQYSIENPTGAFYGREMYERFARAWPGFAEYIADYSLVDSNGNTFYPTAETRAFLLRRIEQGRSTPRVLIADTPRRAATTSAITTRPTPRRRLQKAEAATPRPVIAAPTPAPAPVVVAAATPVTQKPIAPAPAAPAPAPVQAALVVPQQQPAVPASSSGRGLLLLVIGLVGTGILAVVLRTPQEQAPTAIVHPAGDDAKKVEPIRKTG
jgi:hypothetical protein